MTRIFGILLFSLFFLANPLSAKEHTEVESTDAGARASESCPVNLFNQVDVGSDWLKKIKAVTEANTASAIIDFERDPSTRHPNHDERLSKTVAAFDVRKEFKNLADLVYYETMKATRDSKEGKEIDFSEYNIPCFPYDSGSHSDCNGDEKSPTKITLAQAMDRLIDASSDVTSLKSAVEYMRGRKIETAEKTARAREKYNRFVTDYNLTEFLPNQSSNDYEAEKRKLESLQERLKEAGVSYEEFREAEIESWDGLPNLTSHNIYYKRVLGIDDKGNPDPLNKTYLPNLAQRYENAKARLAFYTHQLNSAIGNSIRPEVKALQPLIGQLSALFGNHCADLAGSRDEKDPNLKKFTAALAQSRADVKEFQKKDLKATEVARSRSERERRIAWAQADDRRKVLAATNSPATPQQLGYDSRTGSFFDEKTGQPVSGLRVLNRDQHGDIYYDAQGRAFRPKAGGGLSQVPVATPAPAMASAQTPVVPKPTPSPSPAATPMLAYQDGYGIYYFDRNSGAYYRPTANGLVRVK